MKTYFPQSLAFATLILTAALCAQEPLRAPTPSAVSPPPAAFSSNIPADASALKWDAEAKDLTPKPGELSVSCDFVVTNVANHDVLITKLRTSCGCTVAQLPTTPYKLKPGSSVPIAVALDLRGRVGIMAKTVTVESSAGVKSLTVRANIPQPTATGAPGDPAAAPAAKAMGERALNIQSALSDRQAIFKGDCARCHVDKGIGKLGAELYMASCGICHEAEHRAVMVPDLKLPRSPRDLGFWQKWITEGKPGTLMPAFAATHGGPLTREQVDSLVAYLHESFPGSAQPAAIKSPSDDSSISRSGARLILTSAVVEVPTTANANPAPDPPPRTLVWTGAINGTWDIGTTANWSDNGAPATYSNGDTVIFDDSAVGTGCISIAAGGVAPGTVNVNNSLTNYTLNGPGSLGGAVLNKTGTGTLVIRCPQTYGTLNSVAGKTSLMSSLPNAAINVAPGAMLDSCADNMGSNVNVHGVATFYASQTLASLTIGGAGIAKVAAAPANWGRIIDTPSLSIASGGQLNLTNNAMVVRGGNLASITGQVSTGFYSGINGYWDGPGINSSCAANDPNSSTAVGVLDNSDFGYTSFSNVPLNNNDIIAAFTLYGDANLDCTVDGTDAFLTDFGFNTSSTLWQYGNFDYDGAVDAADYSLLAANFGLSCVVPCSPEFCPDEGCPDACPTAAVSLNTGFNHPQSAVYGIGDGDAFWQVIADPDAGTTEPRQATVIARNPAWSVAEPGSQWISSYPTAANDLNGAYDFQTRFCLAADFGNIVLNLCLRADDWAEVFLNGNPNPILQAGDATHSVFNPASPICVNNNLDVTALCAAGSNSLVVRVHNQHNVAMGFNLTGTVSGSGLVLSKPECCQPGASLSGQKFSDLNGNGVRDGGEPHLAGWTIHANNLTSVTDSNGNYYFTNLVPGTYTVSEEAQAGWVQTAPAGGSYSVTLVQSQAVNNLNFGNRPDACPTAAVSLNTGFNHPQSAVYGIGDGDAFWQVIADPDAGTTEPRQATVIARNPAWSVAEPGSQWISSYPTAANDLNGAYDFQTRFCLAADFGNIVLNLCLRADDWAEVFLNGNPNPILQAGDATHSVFNPASPICVNNNLDVTALCAAGSNSLVVRVHNQHNVAMGFNLTGTVSGSGLVLSKPECCQPGASLSGQKFSDLNGNGVRDGGEPHLAGWTIHANNLTSVTDSNGNYYFTNLVPGTYTVSEEAQAGWVQTAPAGGSYSVTLVQSQAVNNLNFGNFATADTDGDGMPDVWELFYGLNPNDASDATLDLDFDGVQNLLEFAFGTDPTTSTTGEIFVVDGVITERGLPTTSVQPILNGVDFRALYGRRKGSSGAGLTYTVQFSPDLFVWQNNVVTPTVVADDGVIEAVTVPFPLFIDGRKARFFRVQVSHP